MSKLVPSIKEAILQCGLRDGMTVCFHHHLRGGDFVFDMVMDTVASMGIRGLVLAASAVMDCHTKLVDHIKNGVIRRVETNYLAGAVGRRLSGIELPEPIVFRSHGHYDSAIATGEVPVDIFFLAAPTCDNMGNLTGKRGPSACGSLGYAFTPARMARRVVAITDNLVPYPLADHSIDETLVDCVVAVDKIGEPSGIVSGTTRVTRDPVGLRIGKTVCDVIEHSGLFADGFSFQTGAGGISLAAAQFLKEKMLDKKIAGSFIMGGTTKFSVDLLESGCFAALLDVQCMDLAAVTSLSRNPCHREISNAQYAGPHAKSCVVQSLDAAVLGATEIDLEFNVNVHTDSGGAIMGGSGGHSDIAACNKLAIVVAPLWRARLPVVRDRVICRSTPGDTVDILVTQAGVAVNPKNTALRRRLTDAGLEVKEIGELKALAERMTGVPRPLPFTDRVLARVLYRDGTTLDTIRATDTAEAGNDSRST